MEKEKPLEAPSQNYSRLFPYDLWQPLADRLRGEYVGLVPNQFGNVGDDLITLGTIKFLQHFQIPGRTVYLNELKAGHWPSRITILAESGGGNIGKRPGLASPKRRRILSEMPCPKIVLPQSASDSGEDLSAFDTIFVRESRSKEILQDHGDVRLVPDMALFLELNVAMPKRELGTFLRSDHEKVGPSSGQGDPAMSCRSVHDYICLAGQYRTIHTNRLHFGIAALLQGVNVHFLPSSYHKIESIYDTWLSDIPHVRMCARSI